MKVALTGVTGFIGRHLSVLLRDSGYELHALVRPSSVSPISHAVDHVHRVSLQDFEGLKATFDEIKPDFFIHLAALTLPGRNLGDFEDQYQNTVKPSLNLARALPTELKLSVWFGSCEEYGNGRAPFVEEDALNCFSPYGWGKISSHYGVTEILSQRQMKGCWVRPFLTFGPGEMHSQLLPNLIRGCLNDEKIPLTLGEQTRDLISVHDLCKMILKILKQPDRAEKKIFNLGTGVPRTIRSIAEKVQSVAGSGSLHFGAVPYRANEAMKFYASIEKFESCFGKFEFTPFDEALAETIDYFRQKKSVSGH